jgi:hypothetical protein
MIRAFVLSLFLLASLLPLDARSQNAPAKEERLYTDGPVTEVTYLRIEYGHFEEYVNWLDSTWKPTMEAFKKAGITTDYKVFRISPKNPEDANVIFMITYKNMASYGGDIGDRAVDEEEVASKLICSTECQNKASVGRSQYRKVLGTELIRELRLK